MASEQKIERFSFLFWLLLFQVFAAPRYRLFERPQGDATNAIKCKDASAIFKNLHTWHNADADRTLEHPGFFLTH